MTTRVLPRVRFEKQKSNSYPLREIFITKTREKVMRLSVGFISQASRILDKEIKKKEREKEYRHDDNKSVTS
jgi:hypothetical protein